MTISIFPEKFLVSFLLYIGKRRIGNGNKRKEIVWPVTSHQQNGNDTSPLFKPRPVASWYCQDAGSGTDHQTSLPQNGAVSAYDPQHSPTHVRSPENDSGYQSNVSGPKTVAVLHCEGKGQGVSLSEHARLSEHSQSAIG